jgi:Ca-activated chloride channel family protein
MLRVMSTMLLLVVLAAAQPGEEQSLKVDVDLVNLYLTVCNHRGRLISNLARESFAVFEDGQPQLITHFSRETDVPLSIVLLIDTSGSVRDKLHFEQEAAADFLYATVRRARDKAALVTFDHTFELQQDFTDDSSLLAKAVWRIHAGGGTRLYDALYFVMQSKLNGPEDRKVVILITDGDDKSSRRSLQEVVDLARRNNVSIYAISMNALGVAHEGSDHSDDVLRMLTSETGGDGYFPRKLEKLSSNFERIADELRSQYTIGYRSTNQQRDGTFRTIQVELKKSSYSVRTRPGYYAPAEQARVSK